VLAADLGSKTANQLYQVQVSGSSGTLEGPVYLDVDDKRFPKSYAQFALAGKTVVMPEGSYESKIAYWHYPKGGQPYHVLRQIRKAGGFYGVAFSGGETE
jgi:hypothetical protein